MLFVVGMALAVCEMFLPGVVLGLVGVGCMLGSIYLAFGQNPVFGWVLVGVAAVSLPFLIALWVKVISRVLAMKKTQKGYTSAQVELKTLVGQEGVAITQLRPSGMARFNDKKVDVVSEGDVIEKDSRVKVIEVESNRVVVRAVQT
jgi:membrane-bound serine protease (ClpP class)